MNPKGLKYLPPERDLGADDYEVLDHRFWKGGDPNVQRQLAQATFLKVLEQDRRVSHVLTSLRDEVLTMLLIRFGAHSKFLKMVQKASDEMRSLNLSLPLELTESDFLGDDFIFDDEDVEPQVAALDEDHTRTLTSGHMLSGVGEALDTWAEQHNLHYPWVLRVANETVTEWWVLGKCDLHWSESALHTLTSYKAPSTGVFDHLLPSAQDLRRTPAQENREHYKARVNAMLDAYCDAQDSFDTEHGLRGVDAYPMLKLHLTWLALYIVNRTDPKQVEVFGNPKMDDSTVPKGLTKAAKWCGINLSRNRH